MVPSLRATRLIRKYATELGWVSGRSSSQTVRARCCRKFSAVRSNDTIRRPRCSQSSAAYRRSSSFG